ncbi:Short-chain dehydrogenase [Geosmithia morbida]|uniref:Short-chain dehydrogenase n=1 Tax=Geosmithia morbida TaxID=1094350 RepID=A0A9P4YTX5_9HYPO|nr:Short-chain dehydrogenase [Geosmithia morbida]KAF4120959.1 Short-chain dehydrogenase [Geosmithia morbida]
MVRVFITGSTDGIGQKTAKLLSDQGHQVVLHARNAARADSVRATVPGAAGILIGDLSSIAETKKLASDANASGPPFDAIIHNAGIGYGGTSSTLITPDGLSAVFAVNTLAPYILACLMDKPVSRILFMSSDSHYGGDESLRGDITRSHSYSDSKLHDTMLSKAFARRWSSDGIQSVSMHPGWVRTKMGGTAAPGNADKSARALANWAAGKDALAKLPSGAFFTTSGEGSPHSGADNVDKQEELLGICKKVSGCSIPGE